MTFVLRMITALVLMFSLTAALPAASVQADTVRVLPISGDIDGSQVAFIQRGLRQAEENGDTAVVIPINTLGGRVDSALKIRDMIMASDVPVIAYITSRAWSAGALSPSRAATSSWRREAVSGRLNRYRTRKRTSLLKG